MTCKYAFDAGYNKAIDKVREFINAQHEQVSRDKREIDSSRSEWWRLTGQQDLILAFYDELSRLMSNKE